MSDPARRSFVRALAIVALAPFVLIALVLALGSVASASAMAALGASLPITWLLPSLEWMVVNRPLAVLGWCVRLAIPAALSVALAAALARRVRGVRWWLWAFAGAIAFAACAAAWIAAGRSPVPAAQVNGGTIGATAAAGAALGLLVMPLTAGLVRLLARAFPQRNGLSHRTRPAPARGTNVSDP